MQTHPGDDSVMLFLTIVDIFYSFGVVCLVCETGQNISNAFDSIGAIVGQIDWYLFPYEVQRILPIILIISQEPTVLHCFGSISCDRDVSKKVNFFTAQIICLRMIYGLIMKWNFFRSFIRGTHILWLFVNL